MEGLLTKLRSLDAYPKVNEDFYSRTLSGGIITLASSVVMLLLFVSELRTRLALPLSHFDLVQLLLTLATGLVPLEIR
ncbi:hypothetical protein E2562_002759, partial [Oryza meyeriana var. granulata]